MNNWTQHLQCQFEASRLWIERSFPHGRSLPMLLGMSPAKVGLLWLLSLTTLWFVPTEAVAQKNGGGPRAALVELAPVVQQEVAEGQTFVGTVTPSRRAIVGSAVDGRVVEFPINEGDRVEQGQTLAQLLTETISLELEAAEAELELRNFELSEFENGSRPDEIEQAKARMNSAKALADYRESQKERLISLFEKGRAATDQQVDEATSLAVAAGEAYTEAQAAFRLASDGPRQERISQAKAQVAMQSAMVQKLRDQIKKHTVISRFDGYVTMEMTEIGSWVSRGDPVAEIIALDEVDVEAKVVEGQVPFVRVNSTVRVTIPAISQKSFTGTVVSIVPQADTRSRTFPVKVRVTNEFDADGQPMLKSGMLAQVILPTGPKTNALLVPKDSLVFGGPQPIIWVVDPGSAKSQEGTPLLQSAARSIPVQLGVADGDLIQVLGDVPEGISVAVMGNERIQPSRGDQPTMVQWLPTTETAGGNRGTD
ncbi:MAG: efflux RND transporter periplasmic adaptor subunit [Planctomycetaceae bacterium]